MVNEKANHRGGDQPRRSKHGFLFCMGKKKRENYGTIDDDDGLVRLGKGYHSPVITRGRTNWKDMRAMPPSSWSNPVEMYMVRIE